MKYILNKTPCQKAKEICFLFGKENAEIYCNEKIYFFSNSNSKYFIDRLNYWNKVKTKIKKI